MNSNLSNKLIVLVLIDRLFQWSENFITREMVQLKRQGVELKVASRKIVTRNDLTDDEKDLQNGLILVPEIPFHALNLWKHFKFIVKHPENYFRAWFHFLTFTHKWPSKIGRSLLCLFRAASIAESILTNKVNLIHAHFLTIPTETALYLSALTKIPFGCTAHAMDIYKDNSGIRKKLKNASYIVTCCKANIDHLGTIDHSIRSKLFLVNYGIPTRKYGTMKVRSKQVTLSAVGRLVEKKGFEYLLEACKHLKDKNVQFKCRIVGSGKLDRKLRAQVLKLGIKDIVEFVGYVAPNRMSDIYKTSDVLVVPSIVAQNGDCDGLPNVCIEAMSYGLPIIATRVAGLPEVVIDGVNGRLVPPADSKALSHAMLEFVNKNNNLLELHNVNQFMLQQKFDIRKNVALLKKIMLVTLHK